MKKTIKYIAPLLSLFLLVGCGEKIETNTNNKIELLENGITENLNTNEGNLELVTNVIKKESEEETVEDNEEETPIENNEEEENPIEENEEEETPIEEEPVSKIDQLLNVYNSLTNPSFYTYEVKESSKEEYDFEVNIQIGNDAYTIFYSEVSEEVEEEIEEPDSEDLDEVEDEEEEENKVEPQERHGDHDKHNEGTKYEGIFVKGEEEIEFTGKKLANEEQTYTCIVAKFGNHKKLTYQSYVDENTTIFTYQISHGWFVDSALYYEKTVGEQINTVSFIKYDEESFEYYDFSIMSVNAASYIEVTYEDDYGYGEYKILTDGTDYSIYTVCEEDYTIEEEDDWWDEDDWYDWDEDPHHGGHHDEEDEEPIEDSEGDDWSEFGGEWGDDPHHGGHHDDEDEEPIEEDDNEEEPIEEDDDWWDYDDHPGHGNHDEQPGWGDYEEPGHGGNHGNHGGHH